MLAQFAAELTHCNQAKMNQSIEIALNTTLLLKVIIAGE